MNASHPALPLLRRVPYFAALSDGVLEALAAAAVERHFDRGQVIFLEGDPCGGLHIVAAGEVKIFKVSPQGREQILHRMGPGDTFNDVAVLDGGPNPASAGAVTDATLWVITRGEMQRLATAHPALAWALIESIARRARHLVAMVEDLSLRSVKSRLARLLLTEAGRAATAGELDRSQMVTQAEMAARLGTVREMIGRALRELSEDGLIEFDRHRIVIKDREGLVAVGEGM
ncbi:MAG: Crp/Fnr family transcriptional regulator [Anaerolineae bacterium]|jgi:CRP/FNR family transcriptional regulator|nr:Crp/Fnr family transcriptional regulator [Anaerolineae bacterium]